MTTNQKTLKLKYSKVIKPRWGNVKDGYRHSRKTKRYSKEHEDILPRSIQMYRWWFRYLKLGLELESLNYSFSERRKVPTKKDGKSGYKYRNYNHKVVVNRNRYKGWDLDEVLTSSFDKWWKSHSHLFVEPPVHSEQIFTPEDVVLKDHYKYFRIDTRMSINDSVRSIRDHLSDIGHRRSTKHVSEFVPRGEVRLETLFNSYNTLIMSLQGKTHKEILTSGLFRFSRGREVRYVEDVGSGGSDSSFYRSRKKVTRSSKENSDKIRDLIEPGRRFVLISCDGYFTKHPRDKKYFGR